MGGADQRPLCLHGLKAARQELSKSSGLLDLPEHRRRDLLSQSVSAAMTGTLQLPPHFLRHLAADHAHGFGRMLGSPGSHIIYKVPRSDETSFSYERQARPRPKLERWKEQLDRVLAANVEAPARERMPLCR